MISLADLLAWLEELELSGRPQTLVRSVWGSSTNTRTVAMASTQIAAWMMNTHSIEILMMIYIRTYDKE